jgi:hypothetical protein
VVDCLEIMSVLNKMNWSLFFGVLAGIIVIGTAITQWNQKNKEEAKAEANRIKAEDTASKFKQLQVKNLAKTEELLEAYKQIVELQTELKNQLTGGENIPILKLTISKLRKHEGKDYYIIEFDITNDGKYPLQSVRGKINDFYGFIMLKHGMRYYREGMTITEEQGRES